MITTKKLDNGITLNVQRIKGAKTISCFFAFKVGSMYENKQNYGISHLLEHMLFCGTKTRTSNKIKEDFNNCGTIFNGSTSIYYTRYYIKNIVEYFNFSFEIMADLLCNPMFNNEEFIKEKKVVLEEMLRYKDIPNEQLYRECISKYYKNTCLKNPPIGTEECLDVLTINDVIKWYKCNYTTKNLIISFAGNITTKKAKALVDKFITLKTQEPKINVKPYQANSHKLSYSLVNIIKPTNQSLIKIMFEAPNSTSADYFKFIMLANILGGGTSSLLYRHLRDKLGLAYFVNVTTVNNYNSGILIINIATAENNINLALKEIKAVIKNLLQNVVAEKMLNSEVIKAKISYISASEQSITLAGSNNLDLIQTGKIISSNIVIKKLNNVTSSHIKAMATSIFYNKPCVIGIISKNKVNINKFIIN